MIYIVLYFVNKPSDSPLQDRKVTKKINSFHIIYNAQQIQWLCIVQKLQIQTQFHCYTIAHGITNETAVCTQQQQLTMPFTNNVYIVCACMDSRVLMLHMNCPVMGNSFCMNSFWGSLKLKLPRVPKMLKLGLQLLQELTSYSQWVGISLFCFY